MTLASQDKKVLSDLRMARAREFLDDARANLREGRYKTSVNRSYYAALSAARAALILEGANAETHEGVVTLLSLRFVKPQLLSTNVIKGFKTLLSRRTDVDYGDFATVDTAEAEDSLRLAAEIVQAIETLRSEALRQAE